jgi:sulfhydrogenase subunit delta
MKAASKPRIAFFDFACCEGCQLSVLELGDTLLELLAQVEVVAWREVMSAGSDRYDIAFCEGSITRQPDIGRIERIRETADILVSLGACAGIGCHNALRNKWPAKELIGLVYEDQPTGLDIIPARPITAVVPVDYQIQGCPVSVPEFKTVFKHILTGQEYQPPNQPVCVECKLKDNLCVLEKQRLCLGPVTRCGCDAICTTFGDACQGCRGLIDDANLPAAARVLSGRQLHPIMAAVARKYNYTAEEIRAKFSVYDNRPDAKIAEAFGNGS